MTYHSFDELNIGDIVLVPIVNREKEAIIIQKVAKPSFNTLSIISKTSKFYSPKQLNLAKFISQYYFSSLSMALGLFIPFSSNYQKLINLKRYKKPKLSPLQNRAYHQIVLKKRALLFGVTGSGKTEIFISLMCDVLESGKNVIFLMPEISLTPQMQKRLERYFGKEVALWHSKITKNRKEEILKGMANGSIKIIAGAMSSLFVPFENLGLIIVDEEHDDSYKANSTPRYNARDVAVLMADRLGAKIVLASATPSISSYYKYDVVKLSKPYIQTKKKYKFISGDKIDNKMILSIHKHFKEDNQSILFIPTRGNFKYLYCPSCGETHKCPYCSVGMALHRNHKYLKCHYCNFIEAIIDVCASCQYSPLSNNRIGTVEAIDIIKEAIPDIEIEQFDKDSITTIKKLKDTLKRFEDKESHLLVGTQMLSKGHDYANITLSVIMGLDYILGLSDYRARERALSLLFQIAGRSGRAKEADIIIQSANRDFFANYLRDYEDFIKDELIALEMANYPPFVSLARVLVAHKKEQKGAGIVFDCVTKLKEFKNITIIGYGKAPIEKIANKFRFTILLKSKDRMELLKALHSVNSRDIEIDFDPIDFS